MKVKTHLKRVCIFSTNYVQLLAKLSIFQTNEMTESDFQSFIFMSF